MEVNKGNYDTRTPEEPWNKIKQRKIVETRKIE